MRHLVTMSKPRILSQFSTTNGTSKSTTFSFPLLFSFLLVLSHGSFTTAETVTVNIGAVIDVDSRIGKEQKVAMEIAVENFNNTSTQHKLSLHFQAPGRDPLQAAYAAEELIKEKQVQALLAATTWHQSALLANVGTRAQVPVLSLSAAAVTPPLAQLRWPFLVQLASNASHQVNCIASILKSYKWKRVIAIYEDDAYGCDSGMLSLLSEALQSSGSVIEHSLVFPPLSSVSNPDGFVRDEVAKLSVKKSRVFVVLQSSLFLATHLFREANGLGLVGRDSVWVVTESVSSFLDSVDTSVICTMQGALGIDQVYSESGGSFDKFRGKFKGVFRAEYPEEFSNEPGIHALRAYDSVYAIAHAIEKAGGSNRTQKMLLESILSSNFAGLSGEIRFDGGELLQRIPVFRIVNVIGKRYNELGFWSSDLGFREGNTSSYGSESMEAWGDSVRWPGKLRRVPKGWVMPTVATPLRIVIPGNSSFEKIVKVVWNDALGKGYFAPSGFCIDVFHAALSVLQQSYPLPYEFYPKNDTYEALVESVINKTYDAVVGDITILANRSKYVEFTQPFAESGLSMVVPAKPDESKAWMFMKPFTKEMWTVTFIVMVYTMVIVWFLEHQSNPEFRGPWKDQLSTALWFTFSSLFFAHREKIQSNYTKVVVVVWLFVVFVVTSSYTASLTSMLTVPLLQPTVTDIEWLRRSNATVGCDGDSFVKDYLRNVLRFENVIEVGNQENYPKKFKSGSITAAFLELPYEKVFLKEYCDEYTATGPVYRFGGFGFAFQKGSPIAKDFSEAILTISENGDLKRLEERWFNQLTRCSNLNSTTTEVNSLSLQSFWGLYLISGATSTLCFLFFLIRAIKKYGDSFQGNPGTMTPSRKGAWNRMARFVRFLRNGGIRSPARAPSIRRTQNLGVRDSMKWESVSPSEISDDHLQGPRPPEIEIPIRSE
ncbi:hypothetical protein RHMOL_Rhmol02G0159100 [Rhododendron molle]|uniref:Uncharacterized protein n=1 Tax=Rhododendron molle TaxID=49168 RepID=A0ACC0PTB3_RHOML|nr:hypothetical protein RHMOL_Rhmol02G0159100 [Rhododendron molle]